MGRKKKWGEKKKKRMLSSLEEDVKWAKHYSSLHEILLVGEGDFSFSLSLAIAFGSASNLVTTSLDPHGALVVKYAKAKSNIESLLKMGATVLHGVDATKMKLHTDLKMRKFDRIVFNFPHAGFKGKEDQMHLINLHRQLVHGFFKNASHMLRPDGEVHVSHKTEGPFRKWNLEELASKNSLVLIECANFHIKDYWGYNNKRGDGMRCDQPFPLGKCSTFKFKIGNVRKKKKPRRSIKHTDLSNLGRVDPPLAIAYPQSNYTFNVGVRSQPEFQISMDGIPRRGIYVDGIPGRDYSPPRMAVYQNHFVDTQSLLGQFGLDLSHAYQGFLRNGYESYLNEAPRQTVFGYTRYPLVLRNLAKSTLAINQRMLHGLSQENEAVQIREMSGVFWH